MDSSGVHMFSKCDHLALKSGLERLAMNYSSGEQGLVTTPLIVYNENVGL